MRIQEWPSAERPREKLLARGATTLSDAELLALILGSGVRGHDAVGTARRLLAEHGPLATLLEQPPAKLLRMRGIGQARACALKAALELAARSQMAELERGSAFTDPPSAGRYLARKLRGRPHEVFAAMFLNSRHGVIAYEELFQGSVNGAEVHPRVVVRQALHRNAAAVIVGHNHPSGNAEPSPADRAVTQRLKQALALIDVRLLDHFVIGDGKPVSMAQRGWV